jgi:histidinol-phosphatase
VAPDLDKELALALELADLADAITLPAYERRSFAVDWKANRTEVTETDRGAEAAISARLGEVRPHHGRYGEEHGLAGDTSSPWRWIIDPIDGTSNFVRGVPVWATLIALAHGDDGPVVGVVSAPAMRRRWWGAAGLGAFVDGSPIRVSDIAAIGDAQVSVTFSPGWDDIGRTDHLVRLQREAYRARGYGDFWQHMLVAEGAVDVAIDAIGVAAYDLAAPMVVVEQAGGRFTDRHGERTIDHDSAVSSNGRLHDTVITALT